MPKVTQRAGGSAGSGSGTSETAQTRWPRVPEGICRIPPLGGGEWGGRRRPAQAAHRPLRARDRRGPRSRRTQRGSGGAARPGPAPPGGAARGDLLLTWPCAAALSDRRAGRSPFSAPGLSPRATQAAATLLDPGPCATPPAVLHRPASAITRSPQPHPANRPDWLSAPPACGFRAFHWPERNASYIATQKTYSSELSRELHPSYFRNRSKQRGANQVRRGWRLH